MLLICLRADTSIWLEKMVPVGLWMWMSLSIRSQRSRTLRVKKKKALGGITIQTDTHGEDVDAAATDDD